MAVSINRPIAVNPIATFHMTLSHSVPARDVSPEFVRRDRFPVVALSGIGTAVGADRLTSML
jgi:hypothetical protein